MMRTEHSINFIFGVSFQMVQLLMFFTACCQVRDDMELSDHPLSVLVYQQSWNG